MYSYKHAYTVLQRSVDPVLYRFLCMYVCLSHPPLPFSLPLFSLRLAVILKFLTSETKWQNVSQRNENLIKYTPPITNGPTYLCDRGPLPITLIGLAGSILSGSNVRFVGMYFWCLLLVVYLFICAIVDSCVGTRLYMDCKYCFLGFNSCVTNIVLFHVSGISMINQYY